MCRYSTMLGGTTEFNKWEGITYDPQNKHMYSAMSSITNGMEDNANKGVPDANQDIGQFRVRV